MDNSFKKPVLVESNIENDPFRQFEEWYGEAFRFLGEEASAMALCTSAKNIPNSRIVYLRGSDKKGYWFFTNYTGKKGSELSANKHAALLFFWPRLDRQIRIKGIVEKLPAKISDTYFESRPRGSQIGAWASPQSKVISGREELEKSVLHFTQKFEGKDIPRPPHWGGYRLVPVSFEFWQGRESRLHDRLFFSKKKGKKSWQIERLSP